MSRSARVKSPLKTPKARELHAALHGRPGGSVAASDIYAEGGDAYVAIHCDLTFADLQAISDVFGGTKLIDIGSEDRGGGYCPTCAYSYTVALIKITGKGADLLAE